MTLQHKIYNEDGTFTVRDYTAEEIAQQAKDTEAVALKAAAEAKAATDKAAILAKLGITEEELKIALG